VCLGECVIKASYENLKIVVIPITSLTVTLKLNFRQLNNTLYGSTSLSFPGTEAKLRRKIFQQQGSMLQNIFAKSQSKLKCLALTSLYRFA